jgi:hypothetical protein
MAQNTVSPNSISVAMATEKANLFNPNLRRNIHSRHQSRVDVQHAKCDRSLTLSFNFVCSTFLGRGSGHHHDGVRAPPLGELQHWSGARFTNFQE